LVHSPAWSNHLDLSRICQNFFDLGFADSTTLHFKKCVLGKDEILNAFGQQHGYCEYSINRIGSAYSLIAFLFSNNSRIFVCFSRLRGYNQAHTTAPESTIAPKGETSRRIMVITDAGWV
jgi:hypothetical protein